MLSPPISDCFHRTCSDGTCIPAGSVEGVEGTRTVPLPKQNLIIPNHIIWPRCRHLALNLLLSAVGVFIPCTCSPGCRFSLLVVRLLVVRHRPCASEPSVKQGDDRTCWHYHPVSRVVSLCFGGDLGNRYHYVYARVLLGMQPPRGGGERGAIETF